MKYVINADRADAEHPTLNAQTTLCDAMGRVLTVARNERRSASRRTMRSKGVNERRSYCRKERMRNDGPLALLLVFGGPVGRVGVFPNGLIGGRADAEGYDRGLMRTGGWKVF